jgi:succinate dehydrogenase / fumarate reductase flavoprotein subunit
LKHVAQRIEKLVNQKGGERVDPLRRKMHSVMMEYGSVFRDEKGLKKGIESIRSLKKAYQTIELVDEGKTYNYELMEAIELSNQLDLAEVILTSALHRKESRGAHFREDFPARADRYYLKHTLVFRKARGGLVIKYKPVKITRFQPQARIY